MSDQLRMNQTSLLPIDPEEERLFYENELNEARQNFRSTLEDFNNLAQKYNQCQHFDLAIKALHEFLKRGGDEYLGTLALAHIAENLGHNNTKFYQYALVLYEKVTEIRPDSYMAILGKMICAFGLNDESKSLIAANTLASTQPNKEDIYIYDCFKIHRDCDIRLYYLKDFIAH